MTISRKEFNIYQESLERIVGDANKLRNTPWWRPKQKNECVMLLEMEAQGLQQALRARVSKPRKKPEPTP